MTGHRPSLGPSPSVETRHVPPFRDRSGPEAEKDDSTKRCGSCGEQKSAREFHRDRPKKDGLTSSCTVCAIERSRRHYGQKRGRSLRRDRARKRRARLGAGYEPGVCKRCTRCRRYKPWDDFHDEPRASDGKRSACKECPRKDSRAGWPLIRERENRHRVERARRNPEEGERVKRWHAEHPDRVREIKRRSRKRRRIREEMRSAPPVKVGAKVTEPTLEPQSERPRLRGPSSSGGRI